MLLKAPSCTADLPAFAPPVRACAVAAVIAVTR
jgi:hypothetical protein